MSLVLEIPDQIERALRLPDINRKQRLLESLALALYSQQILSFGKAKELAGLKTHEFAFLLGRYQIPRHYGEEELKEDLSYASGE